MGGNINTTFLSLSPSTFKGPNPLTHLETNGEITRNLENNS